MEEVLVAILCFAVIGLVIKVSRLADARESIAGLVDLIHRLEQRLTRLELQVARQNSTTALPDQQPASPAPQPRASVATPGIEQYEARLSGVDLVAQSGAQAAALDLPAAVHAAPPPLPPRSTPPAQSAPTPRARSVSIEERLGQNWLSKIGIVLVVLGVATFLGYKLVTLGPLGKSLTGLATALILLIGGLSLERRPAYRIFARAGIGGGWALLFFTTFALYHVDAMQVLTSQAADLTLMAIVATAMVWHSLRYKSQVVTAIAFLLAFATVGISHITLFSLVAGALLAAALVYVAARESWFELGLAGLCGVYINHALWLLRVLPGGGQPGQVFPDFLPSAGLLLLYWLLFRLFYVLRVPQDRRQDLIGSLTAILNSVGLLTLLKYQSSHPEWAFFALLFLGSVELLLAFLARPRNRTAFLVLSTIASALLLAAIPFRFSGSSWTLLWLFESEALFIAGVLIRERALRRIGLIAGLAASVQLLLVGRPSDPRPSPFFNRYGESYVCRGLADYCSFPVLLQLRICRASLARPLYRGVRRRCPRRHCLRRHRRDGRSPLALGSRYFADHRLGRSRPTPLRTRHTPYTKQPPPPGVRRLRGHLPAPFPLRLELHLRQPSWQWRRREPPRCYGPTPYCRVYLDLPSHPHRARRTSNRQNCRNHSRVARHDISHGTA